MRSASGERLRGAGSKPCIRDLQRHSHSQPRRVVCPPHVELSASGRPSSAPGRGPTAPEAQTPGQPVLCAAGPVCAFPFLTHTGVGPFLQAMPSNSPSVLKICPRASRREGKAACRRRCQPGPASGAPDAAGQRELLGLGPEPRAHGEQTAGAGRSRRWARGDRGGPAAGRRRRMSRPSVLFFVCFCFCLPRSGSFCLPTPCLFLDFNVAASAESRFFPQCARSSSAVSDRRLLGVRQGVQTLKGRPGHHRGRAPPGALCPAPWDPREPRFPRRGLRRTPPLGPSYRAAGAHITPHTGDSKRVS